jgi:hypothetical protein
MLLTLANGALHADNVFLCYAGVGNGRPNLPAGRYPVSTQYAHVHGRTLADAIGLGWIGPSVECDIVLGGVRGRSGVIPSQHAFGRLLAILEVAEDRGESVALEVSE